MSDFFLGLATDDDLMYEGFLDGKQDLVPNDEELECVVTDGFIGVKEGEAVQVCFVSVSVTSPGPYLGYKFKYNAKIYDMDAAKRDRAMRNLTLLDTQAGAPLAKGKLPLTTENMQEHWVGASFARIKIGVYTPEDPTKSPGNYIQGFGYLREKLPQNQAAAQQPQPQQAESQNARTADDSEIDF